jgi:ferritin
MKSLLKAADKTKLELSAQKELQAQNMYRYLANCTQSKGYFGAQKHFLAEAKDEGKHYQIIADFVNDRGDELDVLDVPMFDQEAKTLKEAFELAFEAEIALSDWYEELYSNTSDVVVKIFLQEFVMRQKDAVGEYFDFLATLDRCGDDAAAVLLFDASLK